MSEIDIEFNYDLDNNASYIFINDSMEKKFISRKSIISKCERLVPSIKELKKLNGVCKIMNLYDTIMPFEEFSIKSKDERRKILFEYLKRHTIDDLAQTWDKDKKKIYNLKTNLRVTKYKNNDKMHEHIEPVPQKQKADKLDKNQSIKVMVNKELCGDQVQEFVMKFMEIFDDKLDIQICMKLERISIAKFDFTLSINDVFNVKEFSNEILTAITLLPKDQLFNLNIEAIEKRGVIKYDNEITT